LKRQNNLQAVKFRVEILPKAFDSSSVAVRPATAEDLTSVFGIEHASSSAAHWGHSEYERALSSRERVFLVAEMPTGEAANYKIVGFLVVWTATQEWELENIAVSPAVRRCGIGRTLMNALIQRARPSTAVEIRQEIRASNTAAHNLALSVGFLPEGERKAYYRDPPEDGRLFRYLFPKR
jgi:ribosomal-protein-alanine N-acetyltransferase